MKKILLVLLSVFILLGLVGCGKDTAVEGEDLVKSAQKAYTALDSARVVITDADTDEVVRQFTFRYEDKVLHYLYETTADDQVYYEYNNGETVQIQQSGEVKSYKWPSGKFKKYKRNSTHPSADTGIFFFESKYIAEASVNQANEDTIIEYSYDIKKLSKKMTTETTEGKMTAFITTYKFDKNGNFINLLETSKLESDGKTTTHNYSIEIVDTNNITEVVNPIEQ